MGSVAPGVWGAGWGMGSNCHAARTGAAPGPQETLMPCCALAWRWQSCLMLGFLCGCRSASSWSGRSRQAGRSLAASPSASASQTLTQGEGALRSVRGRTQACVIACGWQCCIGTACWGGGHRPFRPRAGRGREVGPWHLQTSGPVCGAGLLRTIRRLRTLNLQPVPCASWLSWMRIPTEGSQVHAGRSLEPPPPASAGTRAFKTGKQMCTLLQGHGLRWSSPFVCA